MALRVADVLRESACEHASVEVGRRGCSRRNVPGEAAGGCAFDGAQIVLLPVGDAAHLVHGPIACAGNSWNNRGTRSSGPALYRRGLTTDLTEQEIIMGGEGKLREAIRETVRRLSPAAVFVYATCVTALTGEDLDQVCRDAQATLALPVIPVHAAGFLGKKNLGNRLAGQALLEHVIGTGEPPDSTPLDINLIAEYNIAGELWHVLPLLDELGVRVLSRVSGDARYRELTFAHRARLNLVVCGRALLNLARGMEERWGVPYLEGSFYGLRELDATLKALAERLGGAPLRARAQALVRREEAAAGLALAPYRRVLAGRRAVLYTGGVKSWAMVSALQDLGLELTAVGTNKSSRHDVERIRRLVGKDECLLEDSGAGALLAAARRTGADILIAGGRNQYTALKGRLPFLDVNQERQEAYAGYAGLIRLAERLTLALENPVWGQVGREEPWPA
ncbi:MAG: nitrogenase iron-molybdenum cofactor biosynthesis protein NifE [Thermaerobacter sp.]|jgi:nitrogenase molybdenum-cofactor synthesis protein NifE|nr:nitrogenase iron-molybdenum cofactor biosynthesis protein NifE [Thermaerobacter sp.]